MWLPDTVQRVQLDWLVSRPLLSLCLLSPASSCPGLWPRRAPGRHDPSLWPRHDPHRVSPDHHRDQIWRLLTPYRSNIILELDIIILFLYQSFWFFFDFDWISALNVLTFRCDYGGSDADWGMCRQAGTHWMMMVSGSDYYRWSGQFRTGPIYTEDTV